MAFLDFLSGNSDIGTAQGVNIDKEDFKIKDADNIFKDTQEQFEAAKQRGAGLDTKRASFLTNLQQGASGTGGPGFAQQALQLNQQRNLSQQLAAAQGQRAGNAAANQRNIMRNQAAGSASQAQLGAQGAIQEQQGNQKMLQAEFQQQQQQVDQMTQKYLAMGFDIRQAEQKALEDYNRLNVSQNLSLQGINAANQQARAGMTGGLIGGLISGGAAMGAASIKGNYAAPGGLKTPSTAVVDAGYDPSKFSGTT